MMIDIAKVFSPYPSGRVPEDGEYNGRDFRRQHLMPALQSILDKTSDDTEIIVLIDGVRVFGSSFLEEAFGGLAREGSFDTVAAVPLIKIRRTIPALKIYEDDIKHHLEEALKQANTAGE